MTSVASGLDKPLFLTSPPDDPRLFVVEQTGRIQVLEGGGTTTFLDLSSLVSCCGERGLLGLAFAPDYAERGRLFVNYTDRSGDTVVAEYARSEDANRASPDAVRILFTVEQPFPNHNGGMLAFGPDGLLYVGLGDGGDGGDPGGTAQDPTEKLGSLVRIDVDTHPTPPVGNFPGGDPDVFAIGLRNPWRFSFDRATGDLYIGDVGQNLYEEIDVTPAGATAVNYGWDVMEGFHCFEPSAGCRMDGLTLPAVEYGRDLGCSVTGGYVYRGDAIPALQGRYLYGDYCSNRVWSMEWRDGEVVDHLEITDEIDPEGVLGGLSSFGEDAAGELYLVSIDGSVFRVDPE
ncbi:MAG: PQQ-dependent sugar dehydrogenase [Deltaproteobacteria bacterium]|nr:PQQ-dependent sugar dehydrogenase [Deltaproteobacteria bacterium]